jgi:multidrug efflux system membrane fusion protein
MNKSKVKSQKSKGNGLVLIVLLGVLCFVSGCGKAETKEQQAKPVKVKAVEKHATNNTARYSASIKPNTQVEIAFKVGGYVEAIMQMRDVSGAWRYVQAGDVVMKGAELARLRQSDYQAKVNQAVSQQNEAKTAVETSKSQLSESLSAIETAKTQIVEAEAAFEKAKRDYERAQNLYATNSITRTDFDSAKTQYETAQAKLDGARSQLESAKARVETTKAQIVSAQARVKTAAATVAEASIPLQDTSLRSPISGVVLQRKVEVGALVTQNTSGFVLADTTLVKAVFGVPDMALPNLKLGDTVNVTTDALSGQEFPGHISRISPSADESSRVFEIEVAIPNQTNLLKPGMIASLQLQSKNSAQVEMPVVPLTAIIRSHAKAEAYAVMVVTEVNGKQTARLREVTLGETFGNTVAVTNGVSLGERVITTGATLVADGEQVQVIP